MKPVIGPGAYREINFRFFDYKNKWHFWGLGHNEPDYDLGDTHTIGQYIGLLDKNSKEIYEGDIIKVYDNEFDNTFIGEVKFGFRGTPAFEIYNKSGGTYCDEYLTLTNDDLVFEVIGNIYEHPELLES